MTALHVPNASEITPDLAGWQYCGLRIVRLEPGEETLVESGDSELFVLPLAGSVDVDVSTDAEKFHLDGRESVFTGVTDFAYVGRDSRLRISSDAGVEVALPSARCTTRLPSRYGAAGDISVEIRGGGPATREVRNFGTPDRWPHADKLMCCELITPPGNWSSYPPHKHDASDPCQVANEEIYYYRIAGRDQITPGPDGFGLHRTYTGAEHVSAGLAELDVSLEVRDGDVVLIPHGYHGPCVAAPGYPMYYLNVLAGPGAERSMAFCDDPAHGWIRDTWTPEGST